MNRDKWKFLYPATELAEAARKKSLFHWSQVEHYRAVRLKENRADFATKENDHLAKCELYTCWEQIFEKFAQEHFELDYEDWVFFFEPYNR